MDQKKLNAIMNDPEFKTFSKEDQTDIINQVMMSDPKYKSVIEDPEFQDFSETEKVDILNQLFGSQQQMVDIGLPKEEPGLESVSMSPMGEKILGVAENVAKGVTGWGAQAAGGLAGLLGSAALGEVPKEAGGAIEKIERTFTYEPKTESGKEIESVLGNILSPISEKIQSLRSTIGDTVREKTGSDALGAIASTTPDAVLELTPFLLGRNASRFAREIKTKRMNGEISSMIDKAPLPVDKLYEASNQLFDEFRNTGAYVKKPVYDAFVSKIESIADARAIDREIGPLTLKAEPTKLLNTIQGLSKEAVGIDELHKIRLKAQQLAMSSDRAEAGFGRQVRKSVDEFLSDASEKGYLSGKLPDVKKTGETLKAANKIYRQARNVELIEETIRKSRLDQSPFESAVKRRFANLLKDEKKFKTFTDAERNVIQNVIDDPASKLAQLVGFFGLNDKGILRQGFAIGTAMSTQNPFVLGIGTVSNVLAKRLTQNKARFASQVMAAGSDAEDIARAYIKNTPKNLRSPEELSQLLMRPDIKLEKKFMNPLLEKARNTALDNRAALGGAIAGGQIE